MAGLPQTVEVRFRRSSVHRHYDMKRLDDGEDLNDALLDFFVKLGQAVIPCGGLEGGFPSVAYLGSLFFDVLRKGGATDGQIGHANVANWARRRLGQGGLFFDGIGALAVPVNETLRDNQGRIALKEKHWWCALLLNPRGGGRVGEDEAVSLLCLDSVVRADVRYKEPLRAVKRTSNAYCVEVAGLYRQGFCAYLRFSASGDGSAGSLPDPRKSRLRVGGKDFSRPQANLTVDNRGGFGVPGRFEGILEFILDSNTPVCGEYLFDFGDPGGYSPSLRLVMRREPGDIQKEAQHFLGGYVGKEWESAASKEGGSSEGNGTPVKEYDIGKLEGALRLPDVPQQETSNDCGFFILAQILLVLQLTPEGLRTLAGFSDDLLTQLPWPSQKDVTRRKAKLREALQELFSAADEMLTDDVDLLLKRGPLRDKVQAAMWDGPQFANAVRRLAAAAAPRTFYTKDELEAMPTKALRTLCSQRGVLPQGMVERSDLLTALAPTAPAAIPKDRLPDPKLLGAAASVGVGGQSAADHQTQTLAEMLSRTQGAKRQQADEPEAEPEAKRQRGEVGADQHLASIDVATADLEKMPLKTLRALCAQHRVLPPHALERGDFIRALKSRTDSKDAGSDAQPQQRSEAPKEEDRAEKKARWARTVGSHLAGVRFDAVDLEVMPLKTLKGLCMQYKVLPSCAVERADFVSALSPLAGKDPADFGAEPQGKQPGGGSAAAVPPKAPVKEEAPKQDFTRFLGQAKPNFTVANLQEMPERTLRTLCIQHGVLPRLLPEAAEGARAELVSALAKVAVASPATAVPRFVVED